MTSAKCKGEYGERIKSVLNEVNKAAGDGGPGVILFTDELQVRRLKRVNAPRVSFVGRSESRRVERKWGQLFQDSKSHARRNSER